jgi:hypothetical protein
MRLVNHERIICRRGQHDVIVLPINRCQPKESAKKNIFVGICTHATEMNSRLMSESCNCNRKVTETFNFRDEFTDTLAH